jgi:RNA polymerase sigma-70 factor (ECF subfamily)
MQISQHCVAPSVIPFYAHRCKPGGVPPPKPDTRDAGARAISATPEITLRIAAHRPELKAYCRHRLGCQFEAEDAVQEVLLRAWRSAHRFEERAPLRTWLYRIANNVCVDAARSRARRPVPMDELPDEPSEASTAEPALARESIRLALIMIVQTLPPRQRAVLLLRDVLCWRASEVATLLGMSTTAVHSALQRARAALDAIDPDGLPPLAQPRQPGLVTGYLDALQSDDVDALVSLAIPMSPAVAKAKPATISSSTV